MKKITLLLLFICGFIQNSLAQPFQVGHTTITFNDPSRSGGFGSGGGPGRQIQSEVYYPAQTAGNNVAVAIGNFPVIIFGHGFVMTWDAYQNIWDELVPEGYIMVFPRTEGGFSPSHSEFGLDLALLVNKMQALNGNGASIFNNKILPKTAIIGHSMGGGASILAAANNSTIETVIGLAPAETTPSAIAAASNISIPTLILSGSSDGVTPPNDHHIPIYNNVGSTCKYFISATGGAHCYFANTNFNCDFGEGSSSTGISITRPEQHAIMFSYIKPWLNFKLKGVCQDLTLFQNQLAGDTEITYSEDCNMTQPIITATSSLNFCEGDSVELYSAGTLNWNQGSTGSFIFANTSGDYYGYDANCQISNTLTVAVQNADTVNQNVTICTGDNFTVGTSIYNATGNYTDNLTNSAGCDSVVHTQLTVSTSLNASISNSGDTLWANVSGLTFQWLDCDNAYNPIPGENNMYFVPSNSGSFAISMSTNSCADTSDCFNFQVSSEITKIEARTVRIYPNPSKGEVFIDHTSAQQIKLVASDGHVVYSENILGKNKSNFTLSPGIYILEIIDINGNKEIHKLIITQ